MGSLGFLVPAFLAGLAALLVPLVIHLRQREWERPRRFPSLMFLRKLPIRSVRRRRITDWLLLLLRAGVFAALVVAFARPFFRSRAAQSAAVPARTVVLLLDRSMSMSRRDVWPAALDSARRVIAGLRTQDRLALVLFDEESQVVQPLSADHSAALAALNAARPSARGTRYVTALRSGRQVLSGANGMGELYVVTDLQRSGLAGLAGLELPANIEVHAVVVKPAARGNAAIVGADVQRIATQNQSQLLVAARITSREQPAPKPARLSLTLNGRAAGSREVKLPPEGALTVTFDPVPLAPGRARAELALTPDALEADDHFRFVVPAEQALRVLLVTPPEARGEETLFLERALGIGREPRIALERRASLDAQTLRGAALVLLFDTPIKNSALLTQWVQSGGGLIVAAGARLGGAGQPGSGGLLPGTLRGMVDRMREAGNGGSFGEVSLDHPIFAPFKEAGGGGLGGARFLRYPRLEPAPGAEIPARFDDGSPALVERAVGSGKVLLLAVPLDALTGDFPLQPSYLPFLRRLLSYAAGHRVVPLWRTTGETGIVPAGLSDPVVATPGGALLRPASDSGPCTVVLTEAGFYQVYGGRAAGEPRDIFAVNPPAVESDLTPADPRELLLGVRQSDSTAAVSATPPSPVEREGRQRFWRVLLGLAAVLLLCETIVANRGWRGTAARVLPPPSERKFS